MTFINYAAREINCKIVYYGPGLCGKTTNLQYIYDRTNPAAKGKLISLATETDRTLFFDFLPIEIGTIRGMRTRIQLYTVPGQVFYNATRRMVLKGADAVCFVADSQEAMLDANLESYENMRQNLEANEIDPDEIPAVLQYNKRDLPNALPIEILNERLNPHNYPFYEAVAVKGLGVEDTLKAVTKLVFKSLSVRYGDGAAAPSAPGRAPGPPRSGPPPRQPSHPPLPAPNDDLLGDLQLGGPAELPDVEIDENTPVGALHPAAVRAAMTPRPPTGPAQAARPSATRQRPQNTLQTRRDEAAELQRAISAPGMPADDLEMDLEEIQDFEQATQGKFVPKPSAGNTVPEPMLQPDASTTEVEVPIDIEVAPGTTRVSLNVRLVLNLHRR